MRPLDIGDTSNSDKEECSTEKYVDKNISKTRKKNFKLISRISGVTRDIDMEFLSVYVCMSLCLSRCRV